LLLLLSSDTINRSAANKYVVYVLVCLDFGQENSETKWENKKKFRGSEWLG
jgi:hypothetical protein